MPVVIAPGFTGIYEPMDKPRVGWRRMRGTIAASTASDGFAAANADSERTDSYWRPTAMPATWAMDARDTAANSIDPMSGAVLGVIGSGGALPANWSVAGLGAATAEVVSVTPEDGVPTVRLRILGTPGENVFIHFAGTTAIAAEAGQSWTGGVWAQIVAGSLANVGSLNFRVVALDAGGTGLGASLVDFAAAAGVLDRRTLDWTIPAGAVTNIRSQILMSDVSGAVDVTLKIQGPDLRRIISVAAPNEISYCGIASHTLGSEGATVSVQAFIAAAWQTVATASPATDDPLFILFPIARTTQMRVQITGSDIPRAGVIWFGAVTEWPERCVYSPSVSMQRAKQTSFETNMTEGGQIVGRSIVRRELRPMMEVQYLDEAWIEEEFDPFARHVETSPFFIADRPSVYPESVAYAMCDADLIPDRAYPMDAIANTIKLEMRALRS